MYPSVVPVWKRVGQSTHQLAIQLASKYRVKAAHTGILDPLAEGVVVVLLGEERFLKAYYKNSRKVYETTLLLGVSTDTHDLLGMVTKFYMRQTTCAEIDLAFQRFLGESMQIPPAFSAISVAGKRLFQHYREGSFEKLSIAPRKVRVDSVVVHGLEGISKDELIARVRQTVVKVSGDFRQPLIMEKWEQVFKQLPDQLSLAHLTVTTGPGVYIRGLVRDAGKYLQLPLVVYALVRTENASFVKQDCIELDY